MPYCLEVEHFWKNINGNRHEEKPCRSKSEVNKFKTSKKQAIQEIETVVGTVSTSRAFLRFRRALPNAVKS